ncbi:MAG: uracil phosphoribosyltransferase [Myxococcales bacterium]|nr:uracil phosphoribosyltransferase [Myxococcales bacterium]
MTDSAYRTVPGQRVLKHAYGDRLTVLHNPFDLSLMAKIGQEETVQPELGDLVRLAYERLCAEAMALHLPNQVARVDTRMRAIVPEGVYEGTLLDPHGPVVSVAIARAGIVPSEVCFRLVTRFLARGKVRQDHFAMARVTNDAGEVTGVQVSGEKIGGDIQDATVFIPDPMGATGGSLDRAIQYYKDSVPGRARAYVALFLTVTPEAVRRLLAAHEDLSIVALRLDRGLSAERVLAAMPGESSDEVGLTDKQYIVPGAGGVGEVLNNSFV